MSDVKYNRWYCVYGAILIQFCLGIVYVWSIFRKPIEEIFGWSASNVSMAYTISLAILPVMMIVGGFLTPKHGPRKVAMLGGLMVAIGMFLTSKTTSLGMLWFGYGILCGGGVGVAYGIPIQTLVKWFPDKRGTITGLAVGSLGFGSFVFSKVAYAIMQKVGPMDTFAILGVMVFIGVFVGALLIKAAPDGYSPPGWTAPVTSGGPSKYNFTPKEMLSTPHYYILFVMYSFSMVCALMIIGHASPIGQKIAGLTPAQASTVVGLLGIFNSGGRIAWGAISDKIGRLKSIFIMAVISAIAMFMMDHATNYWLYAVLVSAVAICFGGTVGVFPAITADSFGPKHVGINYGLVLLAYSFSAIVGPMMATKVLEVSGGVYSTAFIISGIMCIVAAILAFTYRPPSTHSEKEVIEESI